MRANESDQFKGSFISILKPTTVNQSLRHLRPFKFNTFINPNNGIKYFPRFITLNKLDKVALVLYNLEQTIAARYFGHFFGVQSITTKFLT